MEILIKINRNVLFFQEVVVKELMIFPENKLFINFIEQDFQIPKFKKYERFVDRRFSNYNRSPFEISSEFVTLYKSVFEIYDEKTHFPNVIIDLTNTDGEKNSNCKTVTPVFIFDYWYNAGLAAKSNTEIYISVCENKMISYQSLCFQSESGVFNNVSKALFYLPFLISKTINGYNKNVSFIGNEIFNRSKSQKHYLKLLSKIIKRGLFRKRNNWKLAILVNEKFFRLNQPEKTFWADPFPINYKGKMYVFFEDFNFSRKLGEVCVGEFLENEIVNKHTVLSKDFHLSFPNVFQFEDEYYMMPEQSQSSKLDVYKAKDFPLVWEKYMTLISDVKIVDAVLLYHNSKYWLICNKIEEHENDNNERLYIYYSDYIFSNNWKSHRQNPVIIDKSCSRNAGKIDVFENIIFRKYQNCNFHYGGGLGISKILKLDTENFEEECYKEFPAPKDCAGIHTMNTENGICIVDLLIEEK